MHQKTNLTTHFNALYSTPKFRWHLLPVAKAASLFVYTMCLLLGSTGYAQPPEHWRSIGEKSLKDAQSRIDHGKRAKNIILFVGDGMGFGTIAAARIFEGQLQGGNGEENLLAFEKFPYTALSKTYSTNKQVADSASTMTAIITGIKTKSGYVSMSENASDSDCLAKNTHSAKTLLELFESQGLSTGIVSTARITHATPAATYAHTPKRNWESDADIPASAKGCKDIARQLIEFDNGDGPEVIMGGGRSQFFPRTRTDPEYPRKKGKRKDNRNLVKEWLNKRKQSVYVWNNQQFKQIKARQVNNILGLFEPSHMQYETDRVSGSEAEPSLAEMTSLAIDVLKKNKSGYFLLVEGGRIDHANHAGNAYRALSDVIAFSKAVQLAVTKADANTLIVVTADHSHTLTISGYPDRGNPILGKVMATDSQGQVSYSLDASGLPYTTISYANGPGYTGGSNSQPPGPKKFPHNLFRYGKNQVQRPNLSKTNTNDTNYLQESTIPMQQETHGGMDVPVYAIGPGSEWFHGVLEQNALYWLMLGALDTSKF